MAIEYAFVFPVFFLLFYGMLSYGLIFLFRMGLQHSAEDGARAVLRYQDVDYPSGSTRAERQQLQLAARVAWAKSVAATQAGWMNRLHVPQIDANVCLADVDCVANAGNGTYPECDTTTRCQIVITVRYPYAQAPIVPPLPGFGLMIPDSLLGRARVLLDGRALTTT